MIRLKKSFFVIDNPYSMLKPSDIGKRFQNLMNMYGFLIYSEKTIWSWCHRNTMGSCKWNHCNGFVTVVILVTISWELSLNCHVWMKCCEWSVWMKCENSKLKCFSVKWMFRLLKKNAFACSVIEVAASFLSQHWLADVSVFWCSEIIIEHPSTIWTILDNAIFWMNDHISSTDREENRDDHNEFHFEELFIISIKLLLGTLIFQRVYIPCNKLLVSC